ncbi:MAG: 6-bladed beta-propeller [Rikenellaceae bacterium]
MKNKYYLILCLLLFGCGRQIVDDSDIYSINPTGKNVLKMSDFVDSVRYITLESTRNSKIGSISEVVKDDDNLIIRSRDAIYIYNESGVFQSSVNKKGRGRGEYLSIDAMTVDCKNNQIIICCNAQRSLLYYSYDGKFIKKITHFGEKRPYIRDIKYLQNRTFLCSDYLHSRESLYKLWVLNEDGTLVEDLVVGEFSHPVSTPDFTIFDISDNSVGFMDISKDRDFVYHNGMMSLVTSYDVNGLVASDFKNVDISEFSQKYWLKGRSFNSRANTQYKGDYILSRWKGEDRNSYYTLVNRISGEVIVGDQIDGRLSNSQMVYPTRQSNGYYSFIKNNIDGVITTEINISDIDDSNIIKLLNLKEDDIDNINPAIQFLYVKK